MRYKIGDTVRFNGYCAIVDNYFANHGKYAIRIIDSNAPKDYPKEQVVFERDIQMDKHEKVKRVLKKYFDSLRLIIHNLKAFLL
jgi:hypothetical protein